MRAMTKDEKAKVVYGVQAFTRRRGELKPDEPRSATSETDATRIAQRLAQSRAGVVAFRRTGADQFEGDWREPEALFIAGDIPEEYRDGLRRPEASR
jgi:hypothetical protein